jgi:hypothetical protein
VVNCESKFFSIAFIGRAHLFLFLRFLARNPPRHSSNLSLTSHSYFSLFLLISFSFLPRSLTNQLKNQKLKKK